MLLTVSSVAIVEHSVSLSETTTSYDIGVNHLM